MFCVPGADRAALEIMLQGGLDEETDAGRKVILHSKTEACRPLHDGMYAFRGRFCLRAIRHQVIAVKTGLQRQMRGNAGCCIELPML